MDNSLDLKQLWQAGPAFEPHPAPLTEPGLQAIRAARARKELVTVAEFVWATLVYQIILYSFLAYTLVHNWGHGAVVLLCAAGAALYIPLTAALLRRARDLFDPPAAPVQDVWHTVAAEQARLADFFRFKRRLDWVGVPVSCAIIVGVTFALFVPGGLARYPLGGVIVFGLWVGMSVWAIRAENEKRFRAPLRRLAALLEDLQQAPAAGA